MRRATPKYATNASGSWVLTELEPCCGNSFYDTSIALDSSDYVHSSYYASNYGQPDLKYATNASGSWVIAVVDSEGMVGSDNSIALDAAGHAHISYLDYYLIFHDDESDLKYATNASGFWITTTVDFGGDVGYNTSIALDTAGHVHISYRGNIKLKYATNASGSWVLTTVDSEGYVGYNTSIALDSLGYVHIVYHDDVFEGNNSLKYAISKP